MPDGIDKALMQQALEYHYLQRTDEYYVENDFEDVRKILKSIDPANLDDASLQLYTNLKLRSKFPSGLVNFVRKFKK